MVITFDFVGIVPFLSRPFLGPVIWTCNCFDLFFLTSLKELIRKPITNGSFYISLSCYF